MEYNEDKVDEMALALLYLTSFREKKEFPLQAWKGMDWDVLNRLHEKGLICDAKNKNKSITFTEQGAELAEKLFNQHFGVKK
jgi:hypothetical protein